LVLDKAETWFLIADIADGIDWLRRGTDRHNNNHYTRGYNNRPSPRGAGNQGSPASSGRNANRCARPWVCLDTGILALDRHRLCLGFRHVDCASERRSRVGARPLGAQGWRLGVDRRTLALSQESSLLTTPTVALGVTSPELWQKSMVQRSSRQTR
jgi:hypothetical protein